MCVGGCLQHHHTGESVEPQPLPPPPDAWLLWLTQDLDAFSHRSSGISGAAPISVFLLGQHTRAELAAILASGKHLLPTGGIQAAHAAPGSAQGSLTLWYQSRYGFDGLYSNVFSAKKGMNKEHKQQMDIWLLEQW